METIDQIKSLVNELVVSNGYELYSFKYSESKNNASLEIVLDRVEDISLDDITSISSSISDLLDKHEFNSIPYTLDISSLGAEKPIKLEYLDKYLNRYINVHLKNPYKGENTIEGELKNITEDEVTIEYKNKTRKITAIIKKADIDKARLAIKF